MSRGVSKVAVDPTCPAPIHDTVKAAVEHGCCCPLARRRVAQRPAQLARRRATSARSSRAHYHRGKTQRAGQATAPTAASRTPPGRSTVTGSRTPDREDPPVHFPPHSRHEQTVAAAGRAGLLPCTTVDDHDVFHPVSESERYIEARREVERAKAYCRRCPVVDACLAWALETGASGVWGGTSLSERRRMKTRPPGQAA